MGAKIRKLSYISTTEINNFTYCRYYNR